MSQVHIYGVQFSTFVRCVQLVCEEKGISYSMGFEANNKSIEFKSEEHSTLHCYKKIPVLLHEGKSLSESTTICRYLDDNFTGPKLTPNSPWQKAKVDEWCQLLSTYINHSIIRDYILELIFPKGEDGKPRIDVMAANKPAALAGLALIAQQLGDQDYLMGDQFTLADALAAPTLYYARGLPDAFSLIEKNSVLEQYILRLEQRNSGKKVLIPKA